MKYLLVLFFIVLTPVTAIAEALEIGIFPRRPPADTRIIFSDLVNHLEKTLGVTVYLDTPIDFQSFEQRLLAGRYDLVHLNQYHYIQAHQKLGYEAILQNEEFGNTKIGAVIWVRKDSGINTAADLKGKRILFGGGKAAMVSYIMAVDLLTENGLTNNSYQTQFGFHPIRSMRSLYYKQGAAAGSGDVVLKLAAKANQIDVSQIKALLTGPKYAQLPWAIAPGLNTEMRKRIQQALLALNHSYSGRAILAKAKLTGIRPATDVDYNPHREIVKRVLNEDY